MRRFGLFVMLILAVLLIASSTPAVAQSTPTTTPPKAAPVLVTNTSASPVPVTGNVNATVSGNVNAAVSGNVNANITNTPSVNISSMPAVALGSGATVAINPSTAVNTTDIAARDIVRLSHNLLLNEGGTIDVNQPTLLGSNYAWFVPPGKRLVNNWIAGTVSLPSGQTPSVQLSIRSESADPDFQLGFLDLHKVRSSSGYDIYSGTITAPIYVDAGTNFQVDCNRTSSSGAAVFSISFQGYLVDCGSGCKQQ